MSNLDVIDAYHRGTVTPLQVSEFEHPPPCGGHSAAVWRKAGSLLHCESAPGTSPPAPDPQPVVKSGRRHSQCLQNYRQGGGNVVAAFWGGLPPHPVGGLGGVTGPGYGPGV